MVNYKKTIINEFSCVRTNRYLIDGKSFPNPNSPWNRLELFQHNQTLNKYWQEKTKKFMTSTDKKGFDKK